MNIVLFGSTGMVGQGALRECLLAPDVTSVLAVVRKTTGQVHPKLREVEHADFGDFRALAHEFTGFDACFYCLGITAVGTSEAEYERVTHDYALAAASVLARVAPTMTFVFVSADGADETGRSRIRWARVKGRTESEIRALPFARVAVFRPALIQPLHGIRSRTRIYRLVYAATKPLLPILLWLFPGYVSTTERIGRAMLRVARSGAPKTVLMTRDMNALGATSP